MQEFITKIKKMKWRDYVKAIYVYGSILRKSDFNDVDVLVFVGDNDDVKRFIENEMIYLKKEMNVKLDFNIITIKEFDERIHVDRPVSYFVGIKKQSVLVYGFDYLSKIEDTLNIDDVKRRVMSLCQRARHVYVNNIDVNFWEKKLLKWTKILILELLYCEGIFELDYEKGIQKYISSNPEKREYLRLLIGNNDANINVIWSVLEHLEEDMLAA